MPFHVDVESLFHIPGRGTVLAGVVTGGPARVGDRIWVASPATRVACRIAGLEADRQALAEVPAGRSAAILVRDLDLEALADGVARDGLALRPVSLRLESRDGVGRGPSGLVLHAVSILAHGLRALFR